MGEVSHPQPQPTGFHECKTFERRVPDRPDIQRFSDNGHAVRIDWDSANLKVTNVPEANNFIQTEYRKGWSL